MSSAAPMILIVDDNDDIRESLAEIMEAEGYRTSTASDGLAALDVLRGGEVSLVLLDLMMPRMNGWELIERVGADDRFADLPVIVISASQPRPVDGAVATLAKPLAVPQLLHAITRHVRPDEHAQQRRSGS